MANQRKESGMMNGGECESKKTDSQKRLENQTKVETNIPPVELFWGQIPILGTGGRGQLSKFTTKIFLLGG